MKPQEDNLKLLEDCRQALLELCCRIKTASERVVDDKTVIDLKALTMDGSPVEVLIRDGKVELVNAPDNPCFRRRFFDLVPE
jgi:hypothetical protein